MTLFLLFLACNTPSEEATPQVAATHAADKTMEPTEETTSDKPVGRLACTNTERITWKGDVWLVGGDNPALADIEEIGDGKQVACALAWPFRHPEFAEYSFCEKRSGRGKCIPAREELETLDE